MSILSEQAATLVENTAALPLHQPHPPARCGQITVCNSGYHRVKLVAGASRARESVDSGTSMSRGVVVSMDTRAKLRCYDVRKVSSCSPGV